MTDFAPRALDAQSRQRMVEALDAYKRGEIHVSSTIFREELQRDQRNFLAWYGAGVLAARIRDHANAIDYLKLALEYKPKMLLQREARRAGDAIEAEIRFNLGRVYQIECRPRDALQQFDKSLALDPHAPGTWAQRGLIMLEVGRPMDAERNFRKALTFDSQSPNVRFNRSLAALLMGHYRDGFAGYEARWSAPEHWDKFARPDITTPQWDGSPTDQTVLIHAEQGRGDQIQVFRFLPEAQRRAPHLILETFEEMVDLVRLNFPTVQAYVRAEPQDAAKIPPHDLHLPSMSLFHVMGVTLETIPPCPYLRAPEIGPELRAA